MSDHTKYSIQRILFLFNAAVCCGAIGKTCSSISQLPVVEHSRFTGAVFDTFISSGLVTCAKECLSRHACQSFNFNLDDGTCELCSEAVPGSNGSEFVTRESPFAFSESHNWPQQIVGVCRHHNCPNNTRCVEVSDNSWECVIAYCTGPPTVDNVIASSPVGYFTKVNHSLPLECIVGHVACGNVTCKPDGTWTMMTCMLVSSCSEVRQLNSMYADGEYWLFPRKLNGSRVKVYCHAMASSPSEYISLNTPYVIDTTQLNNCVRLNLTSYYLGYYVLTKLGLDIENLAINKSDKTFSNMTYISGAVVGTVVGCSAWVNSTCVTAGRAVLDLRGTGLGFNYTITELISYRGLFTATWSSDNQLVEFRCYYYCGGCFVISPMYLSVAEEDGNYALNGSCKGIHIVPSEDSATTPTCD